VYFATRLIATQHLFPFWSGYHFAAIASGREGSYWETGFLFQHRPAIDEFNFFLIFFFIFLFLYFFSFRKKKDFTLLLAVRQDATSPGGVDKAIGGPFGHRHPCNFV